MIIRSVSIAALVLAALVAAPASAAVQSFTIITDSNFSFDAGSQFTLQDFDGNSDAPFAVTPSAVATSAGAAVTAGTPDIKDADLLPGVARRPGFVGGATSGAFAAGNAMPGLSSGNYLAIAAGESYTLSFARPLRSISFALGSFAPTYSIQLILQSGSQLLTGAAIYGGAALPADFLSQNGNAFVRYDMGTVANNGITGIIFSSPSGGAIMEIDNVIGGVPEPSTWAMIIGGFGMVGFLLRSRRKRLTA